LKRFTDEEERMIERLQRDWLKNRAKQDIPPRRLTAAINQVAKDMAQLESVKSPKQACVRQHHKLAIFKGYNFARAH
jgi:hypothetical protein